MKNFLSSLGLLDYIILVMLLSVIIIAGVSIYSSVSHTNPTVEDIQEQYIMDLDEAVKAKYEELKRKGLLVYRGGDMRWEKY